MPAAMILSAGRGERLRPLTDTTPKALLEVAGEPLIVRHLRALQEAGIEDIVINLSHLGEQIRDALGDGREFDVRIRYSPEPSSPLGTGGGIRQALSLLGPDPFWVVNADVCTDYRFATPALADGDDVHLVLVDNPAHHPGGDFHYEEGRIQEQSGKRLTFAGVGLYRPRLFEEYAPGCFQLAPLLRAAIRGRRASGEHYRGLWTDVGTAERLAEARRCSGITNTCMQTSKPREVS